MNPIRKIREKVGDDLLPVSGDEATAPKMVGQYPSLLPVSGDETDVINKLELQHFVYSPDGEDETDIVVACFRAHLFIPCMRG